MRYQIAGHFLIVSLSLVLLAGIPIARNFDLLSTGDGTDAVTQASVELPDQPSGDFVVLMNSSLHEDTIVDWTIFFSGEELPVIFEDIECITAYGDVSGEQLAERYQVQLPENQMKLRNEDPTLLVSKAEAGYIDVAILSQEMAEAVGLSEDRLGKVTVIHVEGGAEADES